jgi:hypothetical protein
LAPPAGFGVRPRPAPADKESSYRITNLPVTLLIDREGKIADAHVGMVVKDTWEKEIRLLLKEEPSKHH